MYLVQAMALAVGAVSHPEAGSHSPQTKLNKRPPSGNYEGVRIKRNSLRTPTVIERFLSEIENIEEL